jgi:hypothetical protein
VKKSSRLVALKLLVSGIAAGLMALRRLVPEFEVDAIDLVLVALAIVPWLAELVRSIELPGGFKIELADVQPAAEVVVQELEAQAKKSSPTDVIDYKGPAEEATRRLRDVAAQDPNLALVGAGVEVEKRLRQIAEANGIASERASISRLLSSLTQAQVIPPNVASALADLAQLRNQAAHGASVSSEASEWVLAILPELLAALDGVTVRQKRDGVSPD